MRKYKVEVSWRRKTYKFPMVAASFEAVESKVVRRFGLKGLVAIWAEESRA